MNGPRVGTPVSAKPSEKREYMTRPPQDLGWFWAELKSRGITGQDFAEEAGLSRDKISRMKNGWRRLSDNEIPIAARLVDMSIEEFHRRIGSPAVAAPRDAVELVGHVDAGFVVHRAKGIELVPRPTVGLRSVEAVRFKAKSSPFDGAAAFYRYSYMETPRSAFGRPCVCFFEGDRPAEVRVVQPAGKSRVNLLDFGGAVVEAGVELSHAWPIVAVIWG